MNVPKTFWLDAVKTTVNLMNRLPTRVFSYKSPLKALFPSYIFFLPLKTFGCIFFVHIPKSDDTKLDRKTLKCVLLGYVANQRGYECYHPVSRRKFVCWDVTLNFILFSLAKTSFQGENFGENLSVPFLLHVPYYFDDVSRKGESELQVYTRRKKLVEVWSGV